MNAVLKFAIIGTVIIAVLAILSAAIPNLISPQITSSIQYFLGFINQWNIVIDTQVFFTCMKIVMNYEIALATFIVAFFLVKHFSS